MYKHAFYHRRISDERDAREEKEFWQENSEASISAEVLREVIPKLKMYLKEKEYSNVELANKLNVDGVPNARGGRWNHKSIELILSVIKGREPRNLYTSRWT